MTTSIWQRDDAVNATACDVVIVGAGITGVSAALACEHRGLRVRIIERDTIAAGASGRNAGYLMRGLAESYAVAAREHGRDAAAEIWRWTERNLALLREAGIETVPGYRRQASSLVALDAEEADELEASAEMMREDGFDIHHRDQPPVDADDLWRSGMVRGMLSNPGDASCHPVRMLHHLAAGLREPVVERCELLASGDLAAGVVETTRGTLRADRVFLSTNAYAAALGPQWRVDVTPRRGQMLCFTPQRRLRLDDAYYANRGNEYFRQLDDGRVLMGGMRRFEPDAEAGRFDGTCEPVQARLRAFIERLAGPVAGEVSWGGAMGFTATGLPMVGAHPGGGGRVWFCGGFTGHGMSMAFATAQAAVAEMLGEPRSVPRAFPRPVVASG